MSPLEGRDWLVSRFCCFFPEGTLFSLHLRWLERRADLHIVVAKNNIPVPAEIGTACRPAAILW